MLSVVELGWVRVRLGQVKFPENGLDYKPKMGLGWLGSIWDEQVLVGLAWVGEVWACEVRLSKQG